MDLGVEVVQNHMGSWLLQLTDRTPKDKHLGSSVARLPLRTPLGALPPTLTVLTLARLLIASLYLWQLPYGPSTPSRC